MIRSAIIIFIAFLCFQCVLADEIRSIDVGNWKDDEGEKTRAKIPPPPGIFGSIWNGISWISSGIASGISSAAGEAANVIGSAAGTIIDSVSSLGNAAAAAGSVWNRGQDLYERAWDVYELGGNIWDTWQILLDPTIILTGGVPVNRNTPPRLTYPYHEHIWHTDYAPPSRQGPPGLDWDAAGQAQDIMKVRIINWAMIHAERSRGRAASISGIQYLYERTLAYEMGYVMANIIEKYRLMVEWNQKPIRMKSDEAWDALRATQQIQRLSIEAYHLCMMLHEISRKYGIAKPVPVEAEFGRGRAPKEVKVKKNMLEEIMKRMKQDAIKKRKEKKNRLKEFMKIRNDYLNYVNASISTVQNSLRPWWPIEYGWEIDYKW